VVRNPGATVALLACGALACEHDASVSGGNLTTWPQNIAPCDRSSAEICNGRDDDCDGTSDEDDVCADPCRPVQLAPQAVLRADGSVWSWGWAGPHQGGPYILRPERMLLPEPAVQVTHGCARTVSGRAYCWERIPTERSQPPIPLEGAGNTVAEVIAGFSYPRAICTRQRPPAGVQCWSGFDPAGPRPVPDLEADTAQLVSGGGYRLCARKADGSVWCAPTFGGPGALVAMVPLGDNNLELATYETVCVRKLGGQVRCADTPFGSSRALDFGGPVRQLAFGPAVCALREDGSVACLAGFNQLPGQGGLTYHPLEVVPGLETEVVEASSQCARKRDHSVWCWGPTPVGDGSREPRWSAVQIHFCPERP
jgi:hypothetical protein